jgi:hypothetical protein
MNNYLKNNEDFDPNMAVITSDIDGIPVKEEKLNINITESSDEYDFADIAEDLPIYSPSEKIRVARYRFSK